MRLHPTFKIAFIAAVLAGCGGGSSGGGSGGGDDTDKPPVDGDKNIVLAAGCSGSSAYLCSGREIQRVDRGVALTENGVQVYGVSTSDLQSPNPSSTSAYGLALPDQCTSAESCIVAEVRKNTEEKNVDGHLVLLLENLDITWDRVNPRPLIIDTFSTRMGRATLGSDNVVRFDTALPPPSDLSFYDYAVRFNRATQTNYANNVYFPREEPVRCPDDWPDCPDVESEGMEYSRSAWGGFDLATAGRYHGDGDLRAGDDTRAPNGDRRWIPDSDGFGSSYPGFKGYRSINNYSYQYANLANWFTQDTVEIVEFTDGSNPDEHNKERRGFIAFGDVTAPGQVPTSGTRTYAGIVFGQYVPTDTAEEVTFSGNASITVNYATRQVTVNVADTQVYDASADPVPAEFIATATLAPAGTNLTNYASGAVTSGTMQGGVGARLFGPQANEIGGTFSMENAATGQTAIGGFIAR